jgi:hypothetical protein
MGLSTSIALITFAAIHPYWGATWEEQLQLMVLATTLAATLTNLLYLEPKTTQVGYYVSALKIYPEYSFSIGLVGKDSCVRRRLARIRSNVLFGFGIPCSEMSEEQSLPDVRSTYVVSEVISDCL